MSVLKCVDLNRVDDVVSDLMRKYREIMELIDEDWIDNITFNVRVCTNIPDRYWLIKINITKEGD